VYCLLDDLIKTGQSKAEIKIADFGCGDMQFANYLLHELKNREQLTDAWPLFKIHAFDLASNEILVSNEFEELKQIEIVVHPGVK
jgi:hypothetical protein